MLPAEHTKDPDWFPEGTKYQSTGDVRVVLQGSVIVSPTTAVMFF